MEAPPIDPPHIQRFFGDLKGCFGAVDELVSIVTGGVPVNKVTTGADLGRVTVRKSRTVIEHLPAVWIGEHVRHQTCFW